MSIDRTALPAPVRRWLDASLPDDTALPGQVRLLQEGDFDMRGRRVTWTAAETFEVSRLGFEWVARMRLASVMWLKVSDGLRDDVGWGTGHLWGRLRMLNREGPIVRKSQIIRNLAELAWVPQAALANPGLVWREAGPDAFEVEYQDHVVRFDLDAAGDLTRASAPDRPRELDKGEFTEDPWHLEFSDHAVKQGVRIPRQAVAGFDLEEGLWNYLQVQVRTLELS